MFVLNSKEDHTRKSTKRTEKYINNKQTNTEQANR